MQKILMLAPNRGPPFNEAWTNYVREVSNLLQAEVFATGGIDTLFQRKDNYLILRCSKLANFSIVLYAILKQFKYEIIFVEEKADTKTGNVVLFFLLLGILNPRKCVCEMDIEWEKDFRLSRKIMEIYVKRILPKCKAVTVLNRKTEKFLKERMNQNKIVFVNGVDVSKFKYVPAEGEYFKLLFASSPVTPRPHFFEYKGIELLLEAVKKMVDENKKIKLTLIWRNALYNEIIELIRKLNLRDSVVVVNNNVNMQECLERTHATIFVPQKLKYSRHYPSSIMESLASGKPVIVSDILEISEIIERERCGKVSKPNVNDLVRKIEDLTTGYEILQKNCRKVADAHFDIKNNIKYLERVIWEK